jgi:adenine-specific DNA methylase
VGAGAGEIPPAPAGNDGIGVEPPRNANNYRITDADKLGDGSFRRRFAQNIAAIKLLRQIEGDGRRPATPEEKAVLVKYVGWGGLPQVFAEAGEAPHWQAEQEELNSLLTPDEYRSARATVLNAHYTSPTVIRAMYAAVSRLGFQHGRVLEPACGLGHFFGLMPDEMRARSQLTGVEIDPLTARLARALYPGRGDSGAAVRGRHAGDEPLRPRHLQRALRRLRAVRRETEPAEISHSRLFFVAAAERVRPGGLVAFVTSRGTLDKQYPHLREAVAQTCDLVAAVRLPHTAFKKIANTEVTTDIVILRKRAPGEKPGGQRGGRAGR